MKKTITALLLATLAGLSYAGNCDHPWQRDSAGNSCGGRSSDSRPGGR